MVKYCLSIREIPGAQPEGSGFILLYILPGRAILEELILRIGRAAGAIFSCIAQ